MELPDYLVVWPENEIMVKGHRISLYHVINYYRKGMDVEQLHEWYPTPEPELIRKVLDFYHANRAEVDVYVTKVRQELDAQEALYPRLDLDTLRRRAAEKKKRASGE